MCGMQVRRQMEDLSDSPDSLDPLFLMINRLDSFTSILETMQKYFDGKVRSDLVGIQSQMGLYDGKT